MWLPHWIFSKISFFFSFFGRSGLIIYYCCFQFYLCMPLALTKNVLPFTLFTLFLWRPVIRQETDLKQRSFKARIPSSLDSSPKGLEGKVREKVIEERRWKAKGLPDESQARNLAVKNIFSPPKNEWAESNVTLKENENAWRAGCGPELPCNWIPPWDFRLRHMILCREGPASPAEIWTPWAFLFGEFLI